MADSVQFSLAESKRILLAKALEETGGASKESCQKASLQACYSLGEKKNLHTFLLERSSSIITSSNISFPFSDTSRDFVRANFLAVILSLLAFALGVTSDRILASDHVFNLFSLSFFGLILWNLISYVLVFLIGCGLVSYRILPIRRAITRLTESLCFTTLSKKSQRAHYIADLSKILSPALFRISVRNLHIAAAFFALGLIASLLVRGLSESYWATWESTWFFDDFEAIRWFLAHTYGLIPSVFGLDPIPSTEAIAAMRSDNLIYLKSGVSAAPWVIRAAWLLVFVVIIPRLALAVLEQIRAQRATRTITLHLDNAYFRSVISEGKITAQTGDIIFITDSVLHQETEQLLRHDSALWGNLSKQAIFKCDFASDPIEFPSLVTDKDAPSSASHCHLVLLTLNAVSTPEEDLEGRVIGAMKATYGQNPKLITALLLDARSLEQRQSAYPHRIEERLNLWTAFAKDHDLALFIERKNQAALPAIRLFFNEKALLAAQSETPL